MGTSEEWAADGADLEVSSAEKAAAAPQHCRMSSSSSAIVRDWWSSYQRKFAKLGVLMKISMGDYMIALK